ncbi:hypothetical protein S7711_09409 [Stachybotrys chartarum IBT 7711]|uniref:Myb-like domain-containing protein n=1 Tax=Stachybotrys chartarum (strain CBS 109288 / IBT 7711) TaxID=1280523 RepID=A0A084AMN4_STACB|nr:hypothetical protein S7711_09409 [Stachybotrys chartarum IBT 7711]
MSTNKSEPYKAYCEVHDSFFNDAFFIHNDDFHGYLSKSLSLDLQLMDHGCPCLAGNSEPQLPLLGMLPQLHHHPYHPHHYPEYFALPSVGDFDRLTPALEDLPTPSMYSVDDYPFESSASPPGNDEAPTPAVAAPSPAMYSCPDEAYLLPPSANFGLADEDDANYFAREPSSGHEELDAAAAAEPRGLTMPRRSSAQVLVPPQIPQTPPPREPTIGDVPPAVEEKDLPIQQQRPRKRLPDSAPDRYKRAPPLPLPPRHDEQEPDEWYYREDDDYEDEEEETHPPPAKRRRTSPKKKSVDTSHSPWSPAPDGDRSEKDRFLVEKRNAGWKYSAIKKEGGFEEAESTLRGRFRTLTKDRTQRVRKPQWQKQDIELLPLAVETACKGKDPAAETAIAWEKVATILHELGSTYKFSSGACHKMWDKIQDDADEQ